MSRIKKENVKLNATEVCSILKISEQTLNRWYRWCKNNPENIPKDMPRLPEFYKKGQTSKRYWESKDVYELLNFKNSLPKGINGIMGKTNGEGMKKKLESEKITREKKLAKEKENN